MLDVSLYPDTSGRAIVLRAGWIANAVFAVTAIPAALGVDAMIDVAIGVALRAVPHRVGAFLYAFGVGLARSTRGDNVAVANLFFLEGSATRDVQRTFIVMFVVCLVIAVATIVAEPFGVLVPMLPPGLAGVWAARSRDVPARVALTQRLVPAQLTHGIASGNDALWQTRHTSRSTSTADRSSASTSPPTSRVIPRGRMT